MDEEKAIEKVENKIEEFDFIKTKKHVLCSLFEVERFLNSIVKTSEICSIAHFFKK